MAINPEIHTFFHHLHARRSLLDQLWMTKLQHPQTIQTCHCQTMSGTRHHTSKIIKSWLSAAISESHHTPGLGALDTNLVTIQIDVRNGRVYLQCLGQGLKPATDQGWRLDLSSTDKPDNLNSKKKITFNWQLTKACRISLIQKTQDDPDINTLFQHLHVWHPSSFRDEP